MFLKVCGITRLEDARRAVDSGATALGFVLWPRSPRYVAPDTVAAIAASVPAAVATVGVFVDESVDTIAQIMRQAGLRAVQLHGDEPPAYAAALSWPLVRSVTIDAVDRVSRDWPSDTTLLLDAADDRRGGTGIRVDWKKAAVLARSRRVVLAGGLTAENVADAIAIVRPYGVDVSSGVEDAPGVKNAEKLARFLSRAHEAMARSREAVEQSE